MNQSVRPIASEPEPDELLIETEGSPMVTDTPKPYVVPTLMEPQDMLETTKFFFQVGTGGSGTG